MSKSKHKIEVSHDLNVVHQVLEKAGMSFKEDLCILENAWVELEDSDFQRYEISVNPAGLLCCAAILRQEPTEAQMPTLFDLFNSINNGLQFGRISSHPNTRCISIMVYVTYEYDKLKPAQVRGALNDVKLLFSVYGPGLLDVLSGERTVKEVMTEIESEFGANFFPVEY